MGEWHCVRTRPGAEERAYIGIAARSMTVYLPVAFVRISLRGRRRDEVKWQPIFPGHMFVELDPSRDLETVRRVDGVDDVVRPGGRLAPVDGDAIAAIKSAERRGMFDLASQCRVTDEESPPLDDRFAGFVARIKRERHSRARTGLMMELLASRECRR
jgi:transcription antitermination factor NusG